VSESAVSAKRGLGLVWRETGAVRNARPSRGQAAAHPEKGRVEKRRRSLPFENDGWFSSIRSQQTERSQEYGWVVGWNISVFADGSKKLKSDYLIGLIRWSFPSSHR
jgi:hypothetical protein